MSWAVGYDENRQRFIGYGVTAYCDHPGCKAEIDRGIAHTCGGAPYGGDSGCGLHFCGHHLLATGQLCERCAAPTAAEAEPFEPSGEHPKWVHHVLTDDSWNQWRADEPAKTKALVNHLLELATRPAPERATPLAADVAQGKRQPFVGRLMDEVAQLPVLWGLGEPGALLRHSDVTRILVAVGKEYAVALAPADAAPVAAIPEAAQQNGGLIRAALIDLLSAGVEAAATSGATDAVQQRDFMARFARGRAALNATSAQPSTAQGEALSPEAGDDDEEYEIDHGETVLRVQKALGITDTGWVSPDIVIHYLEKALAQRAASQPDSERDAALTDEQITAIWQTCDQPSEEHNFVTGPLPFARAIIAAMTAQQGENGVAE